MNRITTKSNDQTDISEYPAKKLHPKAEGGDLLITSIPTLLLDIFCIQKIIQSYPNHPHIFISTDPKISQSVHLA